MCAFSKRIFQAVDVFGVNYEAFLYTGYCPFVYDFGTGNWLYLHAEGATSEGFFAYDFSAGKWGHFIAGFKLVLEQEYESGHILVR